MTYSAEVLLTITEPERLFWGVQSEVKSRFRELLRKWHPDVNSDSRSAEVTSHLKDLYDRVKDLPEVLPHGKFRLRTKEGRTFDLTYDRKVETGVGMTIITRTKVLLIFREEMKPIYERHLSRIKAFKFKTPNIEKEVKRYLPPLNMYGQTEDLNWFILVDKTEDVYRLHDVWTTLGGSVDPKHVAWIMNSTYNLLCYMGTNRQMFGGVSLNSLYISPKYHTILFLDGWAFTEEWDHPIAFLPKELYEKLPYSIRHGKRASSQLDLWAVRQLGKILLGDKLASAPEPMIKFLHARPSKNALQDYREWSEEILPASFGRRRFVPLVLSPSDVYKGA